MRQKLFGSVSLASAAISASLLPTGANATELTVSSESAFIIPVDVNGHILRLQVNPGAAGYIILNPSAAEKAKLTPSFIGSTTSIGPIKLSGKSSSTKIGIGGSSSKQRVAWIDRNVTEAADGVISPEALPYETVRFQLSQPKSGETVHRLPMAYNLSSGLHFPYRVGKEVINVRFSILDPETLATASAAAQLVPVLGGAWSGDPMRRMIRFGVERPVRPMRLERPLDLGGLQLSRLMVRTSDNRGKEDLPPDPAADPDEIVVTGKGKKQRPSFVPLLVGMDRLSACSSMTYSKSSKTLSLQCQ